MISVTANDRAELLAPDRHVFVSPHYDDIALSCGGTVASLAQAGRTVDIRVVFGAAPPLPLTAFAAAQHQRWGVSAADVIATRQAEEAAATARLGAVSAPLAFADAIYRGERYLNDGQLFGPVAQDEVGLAAAIASALRDAASWAATRFYVPLGVGGHVDHQLCFLAGVNIAATGGDVWCYEDLPYALRDGATAARLLAIAGQPVGAAALTPLPPVAIAATWETKLAAIFAYRSQVPNIFRTIAPTADQAVIGAALRNAAANATGQPEERYWRLASGHLPHQPDENEAEEGY